MIMCAVVPVGAIAAEEMDVAHMDFLDSFDFIFIVLYCRVNALAEFVAGYLIGILKVRWLRCRGW